ncbi:MAG: bifunctional (p)ppGpp synthetase/guanosine-3',5'-bis(diphosphate) 3'-pyrophosphohydrolase [Bacteroidales bacterium]|nr:bifunctional (p)ppGpp synthetase/guanosine-3',5'-bis(diphosphate) 3'-pyrophosphohydrolase [Bacteroidales bacterium]
MKDLFQRHKEYIKENESDPSSLELFHIALELFTNSKGPNRVCPNRPKEDCLVGFLDVLMNELKTYSATLIAGVLSQSISSIEDVDKLKDKFPEHIVNIVRAFFNIQKLSFGNLKGDADEARSLILSVAQDMRAVLLDIGIQLIRTRNYQDLLESSIRNQVFDLVEYVYIPTLHRLGFYQLKSELEDRVMEFRMPEVFHSIHKKLKEGESERKKLISLFTLPIKKELDEHGMKYVIKSRTKSMHSIWIKMQKQDIPFEKVFDLWAVRLIIDSEAKNEKSDCWHAYSVLTNVYTPNLNRLRDWITVPKETGYESLHATVQASDKHWVEVQIRSLRMDDEAENGMAAHWRYKGGKAGKGVDFWLQNIRESLQNTNESRMSFSLSSKKFSNEVYVFTPTGHVKKLRLGSTALDFAFAIHTDVGSQFASATVNGKIVPIDHILKNGDQVNIITSKNNRPSVDWLKIVVDPRTKSRIKKVLDEARQLEVAKGRELIERRFKNWKEELNQKLIDELVNHYKLKKVTDLYYLISLEKIDLLDIKKWLAEKNTPQETFDDAAILKQYEETEIEDPSLDDVLVIDKLDNINFSLAKCCNPIPGDKIFGFVTVSKGISIHRNNCPNAVQLRERFPYRVIESKWKSQAQANNIRVNIFVEGEDEIGLISRITQVISNELKISIANMKFDSKDKIFKATLSLMVFDLNTLEVLMTRIRELKGVNAVYR